MDTELPQRPNEKHRSVLFASGSRRRMSVYAGLAVVVLAMVWMSGLGPMLQAQPPWPTPPPGPPFPSPVAFEEVAPVREPAGSAPGQVAVVRPLWPGPVPLIPPLPAEELVFTGTGGPPVTVRVEAGAYAETVQVRVQPYSIGRDLREKVGRPVELGFRLEVFDKQGEPMRTPPRRPLLLTMPAADFQAFGMRPEDLLWVRLDGEAPLLLPTQYHAAEGVLSLRVMEFHPVGLTHNAR